MNNECIHQFFYSLTRLAKFIVCQKDEDDHEFGSVCTMVLCVVFTGTEHYVILSVCRLFRRVIHLINIPLSMSTGK